MGYHLRNGQGHLSEGVWKNREQRKSILRFCPDLAIILQMKLERERCEGDNGEGEIIKVEGLGDEDKEEGEEEKEPTPEEVGAAKVEVLKAKIDEERQKNAEADANSAEAAKKDPKKEEPKAEREDIVEDPVDEE